MINKNLSRRKFLASTSAMIPLPFMPSLMAATDKDQGKIKRLVFLGMGFGVTKSTWYPNVNDTGTAYTLPDGLKPLARHKKDFSVIQNLYHQYSRDGHGGSTFWLTGANQYGMPGKSFHNTISVDQVAARQLGMKTRFTSLQLSGKRLQGAASGHGTGRSLAWDYHGKPLSAYETPNAAFHRLFSNDKKPLGEQRAIMKEKRSILDTVLTSAKDVNRKVNKTDKEKLEEYLDSIRSIEKRISKEESWLGVPRVQPRKKIKEPSPSLKGKEEIRIMYDLMTAAMQVDATRVITYRMPADALLKSLGIDTTAHFVSHYSERGGDRKKMSQQRDLEHSTMLAEFFDKLKDTKETDGSSLFDNTTIVFGSNISSMHSLVNCPTLVAGGGAGLKQGQHIVMEDKKTPLCNLWLTLLQGTGIKANSFGDSTDVISELL